MTYFSYADHQATLSMQSGGLPFGSDLERAYNRMLDLHRSLHPHLRKTGFELYPDPEVPGGVSQKSAAVVFPADTLTLAYMRDTAEAATVEGIMGRDALTTSGSIESHRHPLIELRLTPQHFTVELVIGPDAWYDQQNFVGKLSIEQHRDSFFHLISGLSEEYCLGFWSGVHLSDMHLSIDKIPPQRIFFEYLDTFAANRDWLRIGCWYEPGDPRLDAVCIREELLGRIRDLYTLYDFALWTSNNNFHTFYAKAYA
jgi:hypothetical protein